MPFLSPSGAIVANGGGGEQENEPPPPPRLFCYKLVYYHTTFHTVRIAQQECPHGMHPPAKYQNGGKVKVPSLIIWLKCLSKNGTR